MLIIASGATSGDETMCPTPLHMLGFGLSRACTGFGHAVKIAVSSCVLWSRYI